MSKEKADSHIGQSGGESNKNRAGIILAGVFAVVLMVGMVAMAAIVLHRSNQKADTNKRNVVVVPDNVEELVAQLDEEEYTPIGSYEVNMNTDWVFPDGNSASTNAYVRNPENNSNAVYFTIALKDNPNKDIYESPVIPRGAFMQNISLEGGLTDAGVYDAVLTYHLIDEAQEEISTVSIGITITIEK